MNNEFIPYEQALELKKLGFNEECLAFYNSTFQTPNELLYPQYGGEAANWSVENHLISTPLYQQAFRWFREKHGSFLFSDYGKSPHITIIQNLMFEYANMTYEEAELACLKKLIEVVKNK